MDAAEVTNLIDQAIQKAVTETTYTFTPPARSIYSPQNVDPIVHLIVPKTTPLRNVLPREPGYGEATAFNMVTGRLDPAAGGTGTEVGFADAGQPNQTVQTTVFTSYPYKNLGRDVEIGRQQIAANRGSNLEDVRASQEMIKTTEVLLGEENLLMNGNASNSTVEFSGLSTILVTNSGTAGLLSASGVAIFATNLYNNGSDLVSHLVLNTRQNRALSDQLEGGGAIQRIVQIQTTTADGAVVGSHVKGIIDSNTGNEIDVITSRYAGTYAYLLSVSSAAGETFVAVEDLEAMSIYDVPTANHSVVSRVYETCVLKVIGEAWQQKIGGLAT
jgi:hypothetical protein